MSEPTAEGIYAPRSCLCWEIRSNQNRTPVPKRYLQLQKGSACSPCVPLRDPLPVTASWKRRSTDTSPRGLLCLDSAEACNVDANCNHDKGPWPNFHYAMISYVGCSPPSSMISEGATTLLDDVPAW